MLNQTVLVGRLVRDPELHESENGNKVTSITLAVPRSYKNMNGEYDTDFISCVLFKGIAENASEYCHKGDLLGVKGRIQTRKVELTEEEYGRLTEDEKRLYRRRQTRDGNKILYKITEV